MAASAEAASLVDRLRFRAVLADRMGEHEAASDFTEAANLLESFAERLSNAMTEIMALEQILTNRSAEMQRLQGVERSSQ